MNNRIFNFLFLFVLLILSCDDIVEKNIKKESVVLKTPSDGYSTSTALQNFWWEELQGATQYELMIVSPDTLKPDVLVLDTLVSKNHFTWTLDTGHYAWCVRGVNSSYRTINSCHELEIIN